MDNPKPQSSEEKDTPDATELSQIASRQGDSNVLRDRSKYTAPKDAATRVGESRGERAKESNADSRVELPANPRAGLPANLRAKLLEKSLTDKKPPSDSTQQSRVDTNPRNVDPRFGLLPAGQPRPLTNRPIDKKPSSDSTPPSSADTNLGNAFSSRGLPAKLPFGLPKNPRDVPPHPPTNKATERQTQYSDPFDLETNRLTPSSQYSDPFDLETRK